MAPLESSKWHAKRVAEDRPNAPRWRSKVRRTVTGQLAVYGTVCAIVKVIGLVTTSRRRVLGDDIMITVM